MTDKKNITITPASLGLTITSGTPRAFRSPDWEAISYDVVLRRGGAIVWTGEYKLGIGHVRVRRDDQEEVRWLRYKLRDALDGPRRLTAAIAKKFPYLAGLNENELVAFQYFGRASNLKDQYKASLVDVVVHLAKQQRVTPQLDGVVASLIMDGSAFFDSPAFYDWCADYGYDTDSREAEKTFFACRQIGAALSAAFTVDELAALREWGADQ